MSTPHPLIRFTDELMTLTSDLDQATAADFVRRVYQAGVEAGRRCAEAEANENPSG
jgi:hypothetical protein